MITGLITFVIYLIVLGLVAWLLVYVVDLLPLPAPFGQVARIVIIVVCVLILVIMLLGLIGEGPGLRLRL